MQERDGGGKECRECVEDVERMLREKDVDVEAPGLDQWIRASCALGFHPEDIAFHCYHMANWAAMRARLTAMFPGFAGLPHERRERLRLLFLRGADEREMAEEVALVLAVLGAPASTPRMV